MKNMNEELEHICAHCENAVLIRESDICICKLIGAVDQRDSCGKFSLDLLKLAPTTRKMPEDETLVFDL